MKALEHFGSRKCDAARAVVQVSVLIVTALAAAWTAANVGAQDLAPPSKAITEISTESLDDGSTVVSIRAAPRLPLDRLRRFRIAHDSPREVVVLGGIDSPFPRTVIPVGDANLDRIRIGHHRDRDPPELHVVLDLTSTEVQVIGLAALDRELRVTLAGGERVTVIGREPVSDTPATDEAPGPVLRDAVAEEAERPPALAAPTPTAETPAPRASPTPAAMPRRPDRRVVITGITVAQSDDWATVVTIRSDGPLPQYTIQELQISDHPPHHVLRFCGVERGQLPERLEVGDANLDSIRVIHDPLRHPDQLWVVLETASEKVEVTDVTRVGDGARVRLSRFDDL